jgi:hypothetical protein
VFCVVFANVGRDNVFCIVFANVGRDDVFCIVFALKNIKRLTTYNPAVYCCDAKCTKFEYCQILFSVLPYIKICLRDRLPSIPLYWRSSFCWFIGLILDACATNRTRGGSSTHSFSLGNMI